MFFVVYLAATFVIACIWTAVHDVVLSGFVSMSLLKALNAFAVLWLLGVFVCELVRIIRKKASQEGTGEAAAEGFFRAAACTTICAILFVWSVLVMKDVIPRASVVYFKLNKSYIESHWKTDPFTGLVYLPIVYRKTAQLGTLTIPIRYFVLGKRAVRRWLLPQDRNLPFPLSDVCADEFTEVPVEEGVYFVFQSAPDTPDDEFYPTPCRIGPT